MGGCSEMTVLGLGSSLLVIIIIIIIIVNHITLIAIYSSKPYIASYIIAIAGLLE